MVQLVKSTNVLLNEKNDYLCIGRILYPVTSLGRGERLVIWLRGCPFRCEGCMSGDLWESNEQYNMSITEIYNIIIKYKQKIDGITISGGEPFLQIEPLLNLIKKIHANVTEDIILYTGFYQDELEKEFQTQYKELVKYISVIIAGRYEKDKNNSIGLAGSNNQEYLLFHSYYNIQELKEYHRQINIFHHNNSFVLVGILKREEEK